MDSSAKKIRIKSIRQETPEAKTFFLEYTDHTPITYQAGQFLTLLFPKNSGEEARRSYSFCTTPGIDPIPAITVKRITNGEYSRPLIDHARPGDELLTIGASGYFNLPEDLTEHRQIIFLAAGSGITPTYSLIKQLLTIADGPKVTLIYSNRSEADAIFYEDLLALQTRYADRLTIEFLFSTSTDISKGRLSKGLLERLLIRHVHGPIHKVLFYLCGPFDYMRMATIVLKTEGVLPAHIRKENFSTVKPRLVLEPPDKDAHTIHLTLRGQHHTFTSQHPDTILQTAKRLGIAMPYSCESGQCGTCAATCTQGQVWMWNNEVLTDKELAKGRVLTCTGYAVGGDATLEV
jgi:ferredoxin-NADP reductase